MDLTLSPELEDLRRRVARFVDDEVMPLETDPANFDEHEMIDEITITLRSRRDGLHRSNDAQRFIARVIERHRA